MHAEQNGRWWVVGSAWAGRANGASAAGAGSGLGGPPDESGGAGRRAGGAAAGSESLLLSLASEQRLSTDVRKSIFVAIMGADDYVHASERLGKLGLKRAQRAEVVRVLLHCCGAEAGYNAFYALLAARLCASHRECARCSRFGLDGTRR